MNVVGVVAEFNPFHLGHKYLFHSIRCLFPSSCIVCIMSGNFTQRGEIAICNKWARAEMAVLAGADLVIELPFSLAVRSAYYFARGAIQLLDACGIADGIAFGSEAGTVVPLSQIADFLTIESSLYKQELQKALSEGISFPLARSRALQNQLHCQSGELATILAQPNNILAIEYLLNIKRLQSRLQPVTIPRIGQPFSSLDLEGVASAGAIRSALARSGSQEWRQQMPPGAARVMDQEMDFGRAPVFIESLETALLAKLRTLDRDGRERLQQLPDIGEGLHNRIADAAAASSSYPELRERIKTKRYSMTRVNRVLLYALLDYHSDLASEFDASGPLYIRVLAFSRAGTELIKKIKASSDLPVLGRGHDVKRFHRQTGGRLAAAMIDLDIRAGSLYTLAYPVLSQRRGLPDYIHSPRVMAADDQ